MDFIRKLKKTEGWRVAFYCLVVAVFVLLPPASAEAGSLCVFYRAFGVLCPACGTTRAMSNLCHFHFARAFAWNPMLVCFIAPLFFFGAVQDCYTLFCRRRGKVCPPSFVEFLIFLVFGGGNSSFLNQNSRFSAERKEK